MATSKTLAPTNVTISIPAMTDAPNASVISNCLDKEADAINALNSQIALLKTATSLLNESTAFTTSYANTGKTITVPKTGLVVLTQNYTNTLPVSLGLKATTSVASTSVAYVENANQEENVSSLTVTALLPAGTYYVWGKAKSAASNLVTVAFYPLDIT